MSDTNFEAVLKAFARPALGEVTVKHLSWDPAELSIPMTCSCGSSKLGFENHAFLQCWLTLPFPGLPGWWFGPASQGEAIGAARAARSSPRLSLSVPCTVVYLSWCTGKNTWWCLAKAIGSRGKFPPAPLRYALAWGISCGTVGFTWGRSAFCPQPRQQTFIQGKFRSLLRSATAEGCLVT